jgi:hypothetical protein
MRRNLGYLLMVAVLAAACGTDGSGREAEEQAVASALEVVGGRWWLAAIEIGDAREMVEAGANTSGMPWVEINGSLAGFGGCNGFQSRDATLFDWVLEPGEVVTQAVLCRGSDGSDVMRVERIVHGVLSRGSVQVEVAGEEMTWTSGATRLLFTRSAPPVTTITTVPLSSTGRLDCGEGFVVETRVGDEGSADEVLRRAEPRVVAVGAGEPLWWWGVDASGRVIAGIAQGDVDRVEYQVFTCSG